MSLKDGIVVSREIKLAFFETVEAVKRGEEGSLERLSKYVDSGMVSTESYNRMVEVYHTARAKRKAETTKRLLVGTGIFVLAFIVVCIINAFAHSGRTDASGGHRDNKNVSGLGYYHYHCGGNPPHLHSNGYCPYTHKNSSSNTQIVNPPAKTNNGNSNEYNRGYKEGYDDGKTKGYDEGYDKGYKAGKDDKQEEYEELDDQNKKVVLSVGGAIALLWMLSKTIRHNK